MDDERLVFLGENIRRIRKSKGLSQEDVSSLTSIERAYVGVIERGKQNISVITLWRIADALETEISEFFK